MGKIELIRQHDARDCGAACLCMISSYYGRKYSMQHLRKLTNTSQEGISIFGMVEASELIGLKAEGMKGNIKDLCSLMLEDKNPFVLHLKYNHFVVACGINAEFVQILDPAKGKYRCKWHELETIWSGYVIQFRKAENESTLHIEGEEKSKYILLLEVVREYMPSLFVVFFFSMLSFAVTICSNYVFQYLIDRGGSLSDGHNHEKENVIIHFLELIAHDDLYLLLTYMIILFIVVAILMLLRGKCIAIMSKNIDIALTSKYMKKITHATLRDFNSRMQGEYISRISDLVSLRKIISDLLIVFSLDIVMIVASIIILLRDNGPLFLFSLMGLIFYVIIALVFKNKIEGANYRIMNTNAEMQAYFKELLQGLEVIKANNENVYVENQFLSKYQNFANSVYAGNMIGIKSNVCSSLVEQISSIVVVVVGFIFVNKGWITLGEMFTFYLFLSCLSEPVKDILSMQSTFQSGLVALDRLQDIQYMEDEREDGRILPNQSMKISLEKVGFQFPGKEPLFQEVSFEISGNEKLLIQGENGCGKSTLIKLIMGMEKASSGKIKIKGVDVEELDIKELRDKISYVTQTNFLFADTIRNNITFGNNKYSTEEVVKVCCLAGMQGILEHMPMGIDTNISENGGNLSMGQKQAIAIARALIRNPQLLILDEATSNMDIEREKLVLSNILKMDIPCIIVSHSPWVAEMVEQKYNLSAGNERG